jgi:hypothetical protein
MDLVGSGRRSIGSSRSWAWFRRFFPRGFDDPKYFDWERGYKLAAHEQWTDALAKGKFKALMDAGHFDEIAATAIRIESRTNLLFSFEKMALRDAVKTKEGARIFSEGLFQLLYGKKNLPARFETWCSAVERLPRKQTRVLTHPVVTVFPFIADPQNHIFLKPNVTKAAAAAYGFNIEYASRPSWSVYGQLLQFAEKIKADLSEENPKDMIDIQSFIWVLGSDEYKGFL